MMQNPENRTQPPQASQPPGAMDIDALLAGLPERISAIPHYWAARAPEAAALREDGRDWTYAQLSAAIEHSAALLSELGVRAGDRVMVVAENSVAQVALIFAAARIDAWIVNANARLAGPEIDAIERHSGARRIICLSKGSADAAVHGERRGASVVDGPFGPWMIGPLNEACQPEPVHTCGAQQVAALIYTTGTMGQAKGVMLTHRNLLFIAAVSSQLRGLTPLDRAYGVLPISHVFGLASVMLGTLYAGASLHLAARFSAPALLRAIRNDGLTIVQGVPAMYARLLELCGRADAPLASHLRFAYAGGSPLDPVLKRSVEGLLGQPLHNGYGMTESSPTISQTRLDAPRADTSVGMAIPGVQVRVVDRNGREVGAGVAGELWVRGPNLMQGYYREPGLTAAALRPDGWLNTGDMARQEGDGALFIVGRSKELIIRSGFNVYPLEVETAINAHPGVRQSAVVGRASPDGNEEVVAFIEADAAASVDVPQLQAYLARSLAPYKCPSEIIVMAALPAAATGKILKGRLRTLAHELAARPRAPSWKL